MVSVYTYVSNNTNFNYTVGKGILYQAYLNNSKLQNPAYTNSTVTFTYFGLSKQKNTVQWNINGTKTSGNTINYKFDTPGEYKISILYANKSYTYTETIVSQPRNFWHNINFEGTGNHLISINNSGAIYEWYVNGILVKTNGSNLNYNFIYCGLYSIKIFILTSAGNYSKSFIININQVNKVDQVNYLFILYNSILPLGIIVYITNTRTRNFINKGIMHLTGKKGT